jgi:hypothetical protein
LITGDEWLVSLSQIEMIGKMGDDSVNINRELGLFDKYSISWKADVDPPDRHCDFFVLSLADDPYSLPAVEEYLKRANLKELPEQPYVVRRTDGRKKDTVYFVLNLTLDPNAVHALHRYMVACSEEYPLLARDLRPLVEQYDGQTEG